MNVRRGGAAKTGQRTLSLPRTQAVVIPGVQGPRCVYSLAGLVLVWDGESPIGLQTLQPVSCGGVRHSSSLDVAKERLLWNREVSV